MSSSLLRVCFITDDKPGHKNQLLGLEQSLERRVDIISQWLSVNDFSISWWDVFLKRSPMELSTIPDIVVAAGSSTQKLALSLKRKYGSHLMLLMRPNMLPYACFDSVVVPEHDNPPQRVNVISTVGVLNKVRPSLLERLTKKGLIMIGGESKHYYWDSQTILSQIDRVIQANEKIDSWIIGDSRRTPDDFRELVSQMVEESHQVNFFSYKDTSSSWLAEAMSDVDEIWVSPDSVSMVYEALTSGKPTGVFNLQPQKNGRVVQGISTLIRRHKVMEVSNMDKSNLDVGIFCEADRVADWWLEQGLWD